MWDLFLFHNIIIDKRREKEWVHTWQISQRGESLVEMGWWREKRLCFSESLLGWWMVRSQAWQREASSEGQKKEATSLWHTSHWIFIFRFVYSELNTWMLDWKDWFWGQENIGTKKLWAFQHHGPEKEQLGSMRDIKIVFSDHLKENSRIDEWHSYLISLSMVMFHFLWVKWAYFIAKIIYSHFEFACSGGGMTWLHLPPSLIRKE